MKKELKTFTWFVVEEGFLPSQKIKTFPEDKNPSSTTHNTLLKVYKLQKLAKFPGLLQKVKSTKSLDLISFFTKFCGINLCTILHFPLSAQPHPDLSLD